MTSAMKEIPRNNHQKAPTLNEHVYLTPVPIHVSPNSEHLLLKPSTIRKVENMKEKFEGMSSLILIGTFAQIQTKVPMIGFRGIP